MYDTLQANEQKDVAWIDQQTRILDVMLRQDFAKDTYLFAKHILDYLAEISHAHKALFFVSNDTHDVFTATASYGCLIAKLPQTSFDLGEGMIGQVAFSKKSMLFQDMPTESARVVFSFVSVSIDTIFIKPLSFNNKVSGVLEFVYLQKPSQLFINFLNTVNEKIASILESILLNDKTQGMLTENKEQERLLLIQEQELREGIDELRSFSDILVAQNKEIDAALKELETNNKRIMESITYAKRIQNIILPPSIRLEEFFQEHFIIYEPKDVVSGDFYWFGQTKNKTYMAVVDCTGHGVPGAFMSIIGNTLLNQIVLQKNIHAPNEILSNLHNNIKIALKQDTSKNTDGMDMVLCCFEKQRTKDNFKITFAGAKNDLCYLKKETLNVVKGNRTSIGGIHSHNNLHFDNHVCYLDKGDSLYLSSDGFADSCNAKRKKFGDRNFQNQILAYQALSMSTQKDAFWQELTTFRGTAEQRDDITLIGLRL